jgi:hypothetical protein
MMRKYFQEVERSKIKKSQKMMRKDVSEGQRSKFKKSEKMMRKDFQEVKGQGQSSKNQKK